MGLGIKHQRDISLFQHNRLPPPPASRLLVQLLAPLVQRDCNLEHERNHAQITGTFLV